MCYTDSKPCLQSQNVGFSLKEAHCSWSGHVHLDMRQILSCSRFSMIKNLVSYNFGLLIRRLLSMWLGVSSHFWCYSSLAQLFTLFNTIEQLMQQIVFSFMKVPCFLPGKENSHLIPQDAMMYCHQSLFHYVYGGENG